MTNDPLAELNKFLSTSGMDDTYHKMLVDYRQAVLDNPKLMAFIIEFSRVHAEQHNSNAKVMIDYLIKMMSLLSVERLITIKKT